MKDGLRGGVGIEPLVNELVSDLLEGALSWEL